MDIVEQAKTFLAENSWIEGAHEALRTIQAQRDDVALSNGMFHIGLHSVVEDRGDKEVNILPKDSPLWVVVFYLLNAQHATDPELREATLHRYNIWHDLLFTYTVDGDLRAQKITPE